MNESPTGTIRRHRWALLRQTIAIVCISLAALVAVQLADVSIVSPVTADLILIAGGIQMVVALWCLALRRCRFTITQGLAAFVALELVLVLVMVIAVPEEVFADVRHGLNLGSRSPEHVQPATNLRRTADLAATTPGDFLSFRGTTRDGVIGGVRLARDWNRRPPEELWRHSVGIGWSSFAVAGNFCITQQQREAFETVVCYELRTGRAVWEHRDLANFKASAGGHGPRATPTIHRGRVYALGATGILNCLDGATGGALWSVNILADNDVKNRIYGMAGSPLVLEPYVIVSPGGKGSSLVAYDLDTGKRLWAGGSGQASYSSPQPATICGEPQVLIFDGEGIYGHDLASGERRWGHPWISHPGERNNVCQPVVLNDNLRADVSRVFIASGYGQGCALLEVRRTPDGLWVQELWRNRHLKAKFSSVVAHGGHIYGLDERIMVCVDLHSGKRAWKGGRYGFGQLLLVDDLLLVQAETGEVALVEASPSSHQEVARFAALGGRTWNHPVLAGSLLLVRNDREAACFQLPVEVE